MRRKTPQPTETEVITRSRRRCCICFGLHRDIAVKRGQIAHLDQDPSNFTKDNLAFLCLPHHDQYDSKTSQSKHFTINEVKWYRKELYEHLETQHAAPPSMDLRSRDLDALTRLMSCIHAPSFDFFMEHTQLLQVPGSIFHFLAGFGGIFSASDFYIFDPELRQRITTLHDSWQETLNFGGWFIPIQEGRLYRFRERHEVYNNLERWHVARDAFEKAAAETEAAYCALINYVREHYPEVDVAATSRAAYEEYVEFNRRYDERLKK